MISRQKGLDTPLFSNILSLVWALLLPAKSPKGRFCNHLIKTMELKEEVLLDGQFGEFGDDDSDDDTNKVVPEDDEKKKDDGSDADPDIDTDLDLDEEE